MVKLALIKLIGAAFFAFGGIYYLRRTQQVSQMFVQSALMMPRWLQPLFPIRWYQSRSFLWSLRIGGALCLVASAVLLASLFLPAPASH